MCGSAAGRKTLTGGAILLCVLWCQRPPDFDRLYFLKKHFQCLLTFHKFTAATNDSKSVPSLERERWTDVILWRDNSIFISDPDLKIQNIASGKWIRQEEVLETSLTTAGSAIYTACCPISPNTLRLELFIAHTNTHSVVYSTHSSDPGTTPTLLSSRRPLSCHFSRQSTSISSSPSIHSCALRSPRQYVAPLLHRGLRGSSLVLQIYTHSPGIGDACIRITSPLFLMTPGYRWT